MAQFVYKALAKTPPIAIPISRENAELVRIVQRLETEASDCRTMNGVAAPPPRGMQGADQPPSSPSTGAAIA